MNEMSGSSYGQHVHSLYVPQNRPVIPRQRSNSLPIGLALMNAEEAGIIFSAAERATARRRKMISLSHPVCPDSPPESLTRIEASTGNEFKSSPPRQITSIRASMDKPLPEPPKDKMFNIENTNTKSNKSIPAALSLPKPLLQSIPISPLSPKRQVASHSLKSYADGLFQFTQIRLTSTIPQISIQSPQKSPQTSPKRPSGIRELASLSSQNLQRPTLQSKFSDWSVACSESQSNSLAQTPIELDTSLMTPDSFFNGFETTPKRTEFETNRYSNISLASSETYEPPSTLPPPTPLSQATATAPSEEISYFTNFDKYLEHDYTQETWPLGDASSPENVLIDLSPVELLKVSHKASRSTLRDRANTAIRHPPQSGSLAVPRSHASPCSSFESPTTPIKLAEVAIRVPHGLIGAVG